MSENTKTLTDAVAMSATPLELLMVACAAMVAYENGTLDDAGFDSFLDAAVARIELKETPNV